jgi:uncharacterized repeat protein (TIGR01451 family)
MNATVDSADLALTLSDSPDPVASGAQLTYTLTASNLGPQAVNSVSVEQQLPSGPTFVSASSTLGSCSPVGNTVTCTLGTLSAGANATITVVIRPMTTGVIASTASVSGAFPDPNPVNNSANATTSVLANGIDLVASEVSNPPGSAARGGNFGASDTVFNRGSAPSGASVTRYYLSPDTLRNAGDLLLTGVRSVAALAGGATSTGKTSLTVPATAKGGHFYLLACADDTRVIAESNEVNNCLSSVSTMQVVGPDLATTALSNPPATLLLSDTMLVTDTTTNIGTLAATASVTRYYLSLNTIKDGTDVRFSASRAVGALNPGSSISGQASVKAAPGTASGVYYLLACADDTSLVKELEETNNCRTSQTTVQLTGPDLHVPSVATSSTAIVGTAFTVQETTANQGSGAAAASVTRYYLSLDQIRNGADKLLTGTRAVPMLAAGQASAGPNVNVTIPAGTATGTYWLLACADFGVIVSETSEVNNCTASAATVQVSGADLVQSVVNFGGASVAVGQAFTASDTVLNQGNAAAATSVTRYFLSIDTIQSSGDRLLTGSRSVPAAAAGQSQPGNAAVTVPSTTAPGMYHLLACSDYTKIVAETIELNNCLASTTKINITP